MEHTSVLTAGTTSQLFLGAFFSVREMQSELLFSGTVVDNTGGTNLLLQEESLHPAGRLSASVGFFMLLFQEQLF